jgi:hypothetical protein
VAAPHAKERFGKVCILPKEISGGKVPGPRFERVFRADRNSSSIFGQICF